MSLAFLHKKSWHTQNLKNVEQVWLAEQKDAEEARKLEEWKKDKEEERQIMELKQLQREMGVAAGNKAAHKERVDFLYEEPQTKKEEFLLGKPVEIKPEESDVKKVEHLPGSNFLQGQNNLSSATNEEFNKMTNDPLMMMRAEEQKALARIMSNPLKMKQIRGAIEERSQQIQGSSREHKSHKHSKHDKHKKHKHRHDDDREHKKKHKHKDDKHKHKRERRASSGSDSDSGDEGAPAAPQGAASSAALPPIAKKAGFGLVRYTAGQKVDAAGDAAESEFEASERFAGARPGYVFRSGAQGVGYYRDSAAQAPTVPATSKPLAPPEPARGGSARGGSSGGGRGRQERRPALSAEERAERLRQMEQDAHAHEAHRAKRAKQDAPSLEDRHGVAAAAEAHAQAARRDEEQGDEHVPAFVSDVVRSTTGSASIADRIGQQTNNLQRGSRGGAESFMRR